VYRRPATGFVARFLGRANFLAGVVARRDARGIVVTLDGGRSVVAAARGEHGPGARVQIALRQESIRLVAGAAPADANHFPATVVFHAFAGQAHHYVVQLDDGRELEVIAPGAAPAVARGTKLVIVWAPEDVIVLAGGSS
jgi:ABC-type Fe3+/spermidine/putrescine transport system ATPase subunit